MATAYDGAKPCPFCGSSDVRGDRASDSKQFVACNSCGTFGPDGVDSFDAVRRWNLAPRRPREER